MGSCASKTLFATTPVKGNIELKIQTKDDLAIDPNVLLDPRSPDIHRTPLTDILGNRLNYRKKLEIPHTPINALRTQVLNFSINEKKLMDPRSPSQFIPRTPLNISLDDTSKIEANAGMYSIEYNGIIEDESCRNFNERLANITFDDADNEIGHESKLAKITLHEIEEEEQPDAKSNFEVEIVSSNANRSLENIQHTPAVAVAVTKRQFTENNDDDDNEEELISPIVNNAVTVNKANNETFSSTPIVATNGQLKKLLLKAHIQKHNKPDIFEDDEPHLERSTLAANKSDNEILTTPVKRLAKGLDNLPRTPLSVLNRRSRSVESLSQRQSRLNIVKDSERNIDSRSKLNDENIFLTPQPKSKGLMPRNDGVRNRIPIFND